MNHCSGINLNAQRAGDASGYVDNGPTSAVGSAPLTDGRFLSNIIESADRAIRTDQPQALDGYALLRLCQMAAKGL
jgi:hypothetical protein